ADPMHKISDSVWECRVDNLEDYTRYKFAIETSWDEIIEKADPYAFHCETRPNTASMVCSPKYKWGDKKWLENRKNWDMYHSPVNIYEVHLGSWKKYHDGNFFDYRKSADELAAYAKEMNYTHVELLPVTEHPFDGSWGYQCLGYFAPTSRYGTPEDFMYFVDTLHKNGIGVIMDWVPAHFPKDSVGLTNFDGEPCYEYKNPQMGEREDWGTKVFDFGRNEVRCFLASSAMYWLEKYHIDGIRVDAVSSMLYRDYGKKDNEWERNQFGGRENIEAIGMLRDINTAVNKEYPGVMMVAEESTSFPMVSRPAANGGLGFNFKWNMGWMNDTLSYMSLDPIYRQHHHNKLTFGMMYAFSENFILPFSHDEVVHGKCSLISKMPGEYDQKFAGLRALFAYMMGFPGKKLLFMGQEFGHFIEWDEKKELDWFLLQYDSHRNLQSLSKELNRIYKAYPACWENDENWEGFQWSSCDQADRNVLAFRRIAKDGSQLLFVFNFCPNEYRDFRVEVPMETYWKEILSTDEKCYGGSGNYENGIREAYFDCGRAVISTDMAPLSAAIFELV
ncbi:MAG: 1,4-alpha-glucan branching protein GlgB, partial [Oscillospiraceae bacterium]|nr:1,4-alpha-glucan branching protein GlgB [Oscillospiraceae bacterium]